MKENYITHQKPTVWPSFIWHSHVHSSVIDLFAVTYCPENSIRSHNSLARKRKCTESKRRGCLAWQISDNCNWFHYIDDSVLLFRWIHSENKSHFSHDKGSTFSVNSLMRNNWNKRTSSFVKSESKVFIFFNEISCDQRFWYVSSL